MAKRSDFISEYSPINTANLNYAKLNKKVTYSDKLRSTIPSNRNITELGKAQHREKQKREKEGKG